MALGLFNLACEQLYTIESFLKNHKGFPYTDACNANMKETNSLLKSPHSLIGDTSRFWSDHR